jgi:DNA-binding transcriptional regulator YhcF (GntR family)
VLKIERGDGTYVSSNKQTIPVAERRKTISNVLREAAILAVQLEVPIEQVGELLQKEYESIISQRAGRRKTGSSEK